MSFENNPIKKKFQNFGPPYSTQKFIVRKLIILFRASYTGLNIFLIFFSSILIKKK